jgi:hypothetical protein
MPRRKQIYKITYPNGKIYVGMDLIGTLINVGSPSARERIAADLDAWYPADLDDESVAHSAPTPPASRPITTPPRSGRT